MRFTLAFIAVALLLTKSVEPQASAANFGSVTPGVTTCTSDKQCHGLGCFYPPGTGINNPATGGICYYKANLGGRCNAGMPSSPTTPIVLCGEGQECYPANPSTAQSRCRQVPFTLTKLCDYQGEPVSDWCNDPEICDPRDSRCRIPRYQGESCDPGNPLTAWTVCIGTSSTDGGTCSTATVGEEGYGTCTGSASRPRSW